MKLRDYGKAREIELVSRFLPNVAPFKNLTIVSTLEEWDAIKERYGDFAAFRVDMPVGKAMKSAIGTSGYCKDVPKLIEEARAQDPEAVILVMTPKKPGVPRFKYDGGFNASFEIDGDIAIEFVGKAFDGHELTQGLAVHERYKVDWKDAIFLRNRTDLVKLSNTRVIVTQEDYAKQRAERVKYLVNNCHYAREEVEANVPQEFSILQNYIVEEFLREIVFGIIEQKHKLLAEEIKDFAVQGNFVDGKPEPWGIFSKRWS